MVGSQKEKTQGTFLSRILKKRKKQVYIKESKSKYYKDLEIPAKLFFDILDSGDITKLIIEGEPAKDDLESAWSELLDVYFKEKDDGKMKLILRKQKNILLLTYKIDMYKKYLEILFSNPFTNTQLLEIIDQLKQTGIKINIKRNLNQEIKRMLNQVIGSIELRLKLEKQNLKELTKGKKQKFYDALAALTKAGGVPLNQNITLGFYIAYEKQLSN